MKKNSYVVLFDGLEKIYFKTKDVNIDLFDVVSIDGKLIELTAYKKPIESGFDFIEYMNRSGVFREMEGNSYTTILNNPLNIVQYKNSILINFSNSESQLLVRTILFTESAYDNELYASLKSSGLLYLLSSSGLIINGIYYSLTKLLSKALSNKMSHLISLIFIFPYILINIDSPAFIRVLISRIIILYYVIKDEKYDPLYVKSLPFILLIVIDRYLCRSVSILLPLVISFTLYFSNRLIKKQNFIFKKVTFYIVLGTTLFPFNFYFNNCFNVVNNIVNIAFIPIIKIISVALYPSFFLLKVPFIDQTLTGYYQVLNHINFKYLNLNGPPFNQYFLTIYFLFLYSLIYFLEVKNKFIYKKIIYVFVTALAINFMPFNNFVYSKVSFINIGQGDSTLISYKGINILVDTGGSLKEDLATNCLIPYLRKEKIYHLDYVLITHYDMDHYYALDSLKKNFIVRNIYDYNYCPSIKYGNLSIHNINKDISNVVEENDKSLVLLTEVNSISFVLMGDASKSIEYKLIKEYPDLDVDYLKCGHHGSSTSTSDEFVKLLTPKEAIISCGENNKYGHPNMEVIDVLTKNNVKIRRTDIEGTITYKFFG